jgi:dTDP-4-dehydrorhamnose reductase
MQKKVLILGKGYVGNHLFNYLEKKDVFVSIASRDEIDYHHKDVLEYHIQFYDVVIGAFGFTGNPNVDSVGLPQNRENALFLNSVLPKIIEERCKRLGVEYHHISTGCIYTYDNYNDLNKPNEIIEYKETDIPNFGFYQDYSSYYSKTKHLFEVHADKSYTYLYRIRMPFNQQNISKNILKKFTANFKYVHSSMNSLTHLDLLSDTIYNAIDKKWRPGIYNVVSGHSTAKEIIEIYNSVFPEKPCDSKFITYKELMDMKIHKENRSNCILSNNKILFNGIYLPDLKTQIKETFELWKSNTK